MSGFKIDKIVNKKACCCFVFSDCIPVSKEIDVILIEIIIILKECKLKKNEFIKSKHEHQGHV